MDCVNFSSNNRAWLERVGKERSANRKHVFAYYGPDGGRELLAPKVPPAPTVEDANKAFFDRIYRESSQPPGLRGTTPGRQRLRRSLGTSSQILSDDRQGFASIFASGVVRPPATAGRRPERATEASVADLLFFNGGQQAAVPPTPSVRSQGTGISKASTLWRHVEEAVQQEVAKAVRPLQEQLESETAARKRVELALKRVAATSLSQS